MQTPMDLTLTWLDMLKETLRQGDKVNPRGRATLEIPQRTIVVDTRKPVLMIPERKLSYQFMAAEAFWILSGGNEVKDIAPYNKNISNYSDDGKTFYGAYGPRIKSQIKGVLEKLLNDKDTRQAGLTIWIENPKETKDVPCTVAVFFSIRQNMLNAHVFMRSSDIWLGIPYDVFNFSMLTHQVCAMYNEKTEGNTIFPGNLYLTAASSHLYAIHFHEAESLVNGNVTVVTQSPTPEFTYLSERELMTTLEDLRETKPGSSLRWWEENVLN